MKTSGTRARIVVFLVTFAAFAALAGFAQAASSKPAAMTRAEYQALMRRGNALNARYGNVVTRLTPAEFKALWQVGGDRLEPQELVALVARSVALNRMHGLG